MSGRLTKDCLRSSSNPFFDKQMGIEKGELFQNSDGTIFDSSSINVLHNGIDTIKQLYEGLVIDEIFQSIKLAYEDNQNEILINETLWKLGSGRRGGYRYSLNSRDLGIFILFGSFYTETKYNGHHLKIELSPDLILSNKVDDIQQIMDDLAKFFITQLRHTGVAVHICADIQGWDIPDDLDRCMTTKARRVYKASGVSSMEFENHAITTVWGKGETFTFGTVSALQFSVYDKSKEVKKHDKLEFWESKWNIEKDLLIPSRYDSEKTVVRLEARFHHSVIAQFARGISQDLRSFKNVSKHLTGLWKYSLDNFRLDSSPTYINSFWQFMRDDLIFHHDLKAIEYKRVFKKALDSSDPSDRSLLICFGQLSSIYAKNKYKFSQASTYLLNSGIFSSLCKMFIGRGVFYDEVANHVYGILFDKLDAYGYEL